MRKLFVAVLFLLSTSVTKAQVNVGDMAPEIALQNKKDSIVKLSSFKGKVVLIDFWASGVDLAGNRTRQ